jgi:hypothetical protein
MAALTNYAEERLLRHLLGDSAFTIPAAHYLALHTADPGETGATAEVSGGSYARKLIAFDWNSGGSRVENNAAVTFTSMPAGTVSHFSIWDALTSGNCLVKGALASPQTLSAGQSITAATGEIRVTAD